MRERVIAGFLVVALGILGLPAGAAALFGGADLDEDLLFALEQDPLGTHVAVAATDGLPTGALVSALEVLGLDVTPMVNLPAVAVRGSATMIRAAAGVTGVDKLWFNAPLDQAAYTSSRSVIQADVVHTAPDLGFTGVGVTIAVLDSGIEATHPDLEFGSKTIQNVKILGNQHLLPDLTVAVEDVPDTDTTTGHGTHVAGIAAGSGAASNGLYAGVAPGASLVGVGAADGIEMLTALAGYDWILSNHDEYGIRIINNSWADGSIEYDPEHPLNVASKRAHDAGIVVVFAAGNDGQQSGNVFNRYAYPDWVVSVGGGTKLGTLGSFSSRGSDLHHADVVAPGEFIVSTMAKTGVVGIPNQTPLDLTYPMDPHVLAPEHIPYYTVKVGTSMAAPHVAGIAALMLEANPSLTPDQIRQLLIDTASPMPGCAPMDCGAGYVNALAAVRAALSAATPAPQPPAAAVTATPTTGAAPLLVTFDASASVDGDGQVVAYQWDLHGDGTAVETTSPTISHSYGPGVHIVTVVAVDDDGLASAPASVTVRASDPPTAVADVPNHARSGQTILFDASRSFDPDGQVVSYTFEFGDGTVVTTSSDRVPHTFTTAGPVRRAWRVVVTDDAGLQDAITGTIKVTP